MFQEKKRIAHETTTEQIRLEEVAIGRSDIAKEAIATANAAEAQAVNEKESFEHAASVAVSEQHAAEVRSEAANRTISEMNNAKDASLIMKAHWEEERSSAVSKRETMMAAHEIAEA